MSKFHSTVTRRDFMKGLGLAGAGLGAASAASPVFRDLDELKSSGLRGIKKPWYAKEVDVPTVEIDLAMREPYTYANNVVSGYRNYIEGGIPEFLKIFSKDEELIRKRIKSNKPGDTLKDWAACQALCYQNYRGTLTHPDASYCGIRTADTPESLGVPKYQGTPEENTNMLLTVCRLAGYSCMGIVDLDNTSVGPIRNLFYDNNHFEDGIEDYYKLDNGQYVTPMKAKYAIVPVAQFGHTKIMGNHTFIAQAGQLSHNPDLNKVRNFLWGLGYLGLSPSVPFPPMCILSGVSEYNRTHGPGIGPQGGIEYMNSNTVILTDLPLAPTKPIDMGVLRWCKDCGRCADACPSGAIQKEKEPTWEINTGLWNSSNDHKGYWNNSFKCMEYQTNGPAVWPRNGSLFIGLCFNCAAACPFSKEHTSWIHDVVKTVASTTGVFNSFMVKMDEWYGYGWCPPTWNGIAENPRAADFWSIDMPEYGMHSVVKEY